MSLVELREFTSFSLGEIGIFLIIIWLICVIVFNTLSAIILIYCGLTQSSKKLGDGYIDNRPLFLR